MEKATLILEHIMLKGSWARMTLALSRTKEKVTVYERWEVEAQTINPGRQGLWARICLLGHCEEFELYLRTDTALSGLFMFLYFSQLLSCYSCSFLCLWSSAAAPHTLHVPNTSRNYRAWGIKKVWGRGTRGHLFFCFLAKYVPNAAHRFCLPWEGFPDWRETLDWVGMGVTFPVALWWILLRILTRWS